jgi:hypothetical protein
VTLSAFSARSTSSVLSATRAWQVLEQLRVAAAEQAAQARRGAPGDAVVHGRQLRVEHGVVVAQLEQLRVRELEDVLHVGVGRARLDDERVVPREDRQVVGVVAEAVRQQLAPRVGRSGRDSASSNGTTARRRAGRARPARRPRRAAR